MLTVIYMDYGRVRNRMKTVVITGSARGFGYAMLEDFYRNNFNVVICDINEEELKKAKEKIMNILERYLVI